MSVLFINHKHIDTVIFDFDGTLAELNIDFNQMRRTINELVDGYGIDHQILRHKFVLEIIEEAGALLQKKSNKKQESFARDACRLIEDIEIAAARRGELFSGTKDLLTSLRKQSIRVGIITRNCSKAVHTVFPDIQSYCPMIICRGDVHHVKPHPEQINLALTRLGSRPDSSIMIGDHPLDVETGRNVGTLTAGVLTGHFQVNDFIKVCADIVLHHAPDILKFMEPAQYG